MNRQMMGKTNSIWLEKNMRRKTPKMCKARKNNIKWMKILQSPKYLGNKKMKKIRKQLTVLMNKSSETTSNNMSIHIISWT
eukprot:4835331-Heterocapsa_arctica.AAC.1